MQEKISLTPELAQQFNDFINAVSGVAIAIHSAREPHRFVVEFGEETLKRFDRALDLFEKFAPAPRIHSLVFAFAGEKPTGGTMDVKDDGGVRHLQVVGLDGAGNVVPMPADAKAVFSGGDDTLATMTPAADGSPKVDITPTGKLGSFTVSVTVTFADASTLTGTGSFNVVVDPIIKSLGFADVPA